MVIPQELNFTVNCTVGQEMSPTRWKGNVYNVFFKSQESFENSDLMLKTNILTHLQ